MEKKNCLIIGAGPAAITTAVNLKKGLSSSMGLATRRSKKSKEFAIELEQGGGFVHSIAEHYKDSLVAGSLKLDYFYEGFEDIEDIWSVVVLCTPCDSYVEILEKLSYLKGVETIVLISPSIGSNLIVRNYYREQEREIDVVSLSTYYAASKQHDEDSLLTIITKGVKKRVYIGADTEESYGLDLVAKLLDNMSISYRKLGSSVEAESRNINIYVHSPFCINEYSLDYIFGRVEGKRFIYKIYPEGPICRDSIETMVELWKEVSLFLREFGVKPFNLLKFLNDDNYPVLEKSLSREEIEGFADFDKIKQEYLLYVRYSSILIDPFSKPDKDGKYLDFSAFPFKKVYMDNQNRWAIPRIPFEDYKKLKVIYKLAKNLGVELKRIKELIDLFEVYREQFVEEVGEDKLNKFYMVDNSSDEVKRIMNERSFLNE